MGTWGTGPFDNDAAADWCGEFNDANSGDRPALIRAAPTGAADETDYLDSDVAYEAIVAAAIVAAHRAGGQQITSADAPASLREGGRLDLPDNVAGPAVRAIDRVMADESEWREPWEDASEDDSRAAFDNVRGLRSVLSA